MDYEKICEISRRLALEAGAAIMEVYHSPDFDVRAKSDDSPVTAADEAADKLISAGLTEAFPDIPLVTEEQAASHSQTGLTTFFLIDPLDGTKEFVQRRGDFTVNIALIENGVPTRGVVYAPAKNRMFWTDASGQTVEETGALDPATVGETRPLKVATPGEKLRVVASKSHRDAATDTYIAKYPVGDFLSAGSSLKFCLIAAGEADLYPRLGRTMEWDTGAAHAVLLGAGGQVVRFDDHTPLTYGKPIYENPFFIAYAPGVSLAEG
ncbi:3'(2'),5'-bisphosphate nucleotidase CysQ [Paroceanicella profunda]|uniref:3'(2'),5'-bisphosphate nucleotidase CysQ n=1 Tax=Paroceanicella profunda TaxID=2579971 RepID=A0A5B8FQC2_9RHOB|nr:3'(2'),5'-bisphosphate nucleotidase CysQ [Paroceanicella profunda]QDL90806.1 3'(2'),5'-bisphosphate nucleotidase CysQ [Paroceanicella profunda]